MEGFLVVGSSFLHVSCDVFVLSYLNVVLCKLHFREVTYLKTINGSLNVGLMWLPYCAGVLMRYLVICR